MTSCHSDASCDSEHSPKTRDFHPNLTAVFSPYLNHLFPPFGAMQPYRIVIYGVCMEQGTHWSIINVRLSRVVPLIIASATIGFSAPAMAVGTAAGTTISNTATASYTDPGGNPVSVPSNKVDIVVDELLDVTVATADPGDIVVTPGSTNQVLSFIVTNTGNGSEAFRLTPNATVGGDQFDPTTTSIVLDTNDNGVYDAGPGGDEIYTPGVTDPRLAPDASVRVFVLSSIPAGTADVDRGIVELTAAATTGTGAPGTTFAGQGQGGGNAVVGSTGADGTDRGRYLVQNATITFTKSAVVADPFGGTTSVPGSIITYTLVATISGSGTLTNAAINDPIPVGTTYQIGSITLQGSALTDTADGDAGSFASNSISVGLGSVTGGQTRTVTFRTRIN
jgi:uncharacterized repeat protein (TIGR01451 family)